MRILAVRGENLASLAREFAIDLDDGPLASNGVFAIVGPTGAGKSTLLDAICVALFDRTPRLGGRSSVLIGRGDDVVKLGAHDVRTILRRGATRGWAEVDFEGVDGRRYRSRWEVWRAQRGASGRLQDQRITLTSIDSGERIGGTRTETLDAIRARLGLKFEQFCRSALLAQGEFAAFLRADAADRADLLERMTGTEIYGALSIRAHARAGEIEAGLRERRAALAQIAVLGDDERAAVVTERGRGESALVEARARHAAIAARAAWAVGREDRVAAIAAAESVKAAAARDVAAAGGLRDRIERARRAEAVRPAWSERGRAEAEVAEATRAMAGAKAAIDAIVAAREEAVRARDGGDEVLARVRQVRSQAGLAPPDPPARDSAARIAAKPPVRVERGAIEQKLRGLATALAALEARRAGAIEAIAAAKGAVAKAEKDAAGFEAARKKAPIDAAKRGYAAAEREVAAARGLAERVAIARAASAEVATATEQRAAEVAAIEALRTDEARATAAAAEARARYDEAQAGLDRLVAAAALDHHRSALVDGEPCPLCGSTAHPWAGRGAMDQLIAADRLRVAALRTAIEHAVAAIAAARKAIEARAANIARLEAIAAAAVARRAEAGAQFKAALAAIGELPFTDDPSDAAAARVATERMAAAERGLTAARRAFDAAQAAAQAAADARAEVLARQADLDHAVAARATVEADGAEIATTLRALEGALAAAQAAADTAIHGHDRELAAAEAAAHAALAAAERASSRHAMANAAVATAIRIADLAPDEIADLLPRPPAWIDTARAELEAIAARHARAVAIVEERVGQLASHDASRPPFAADDATPLPALVAAAAARITALDHAIAIAGERLRSDDAARARRAIAEAELADTEAAAATDRVLADLIGSHDGKAFRSFAQSLTLDALLVVANDHLLQLAPRYQLERVPGHDLELQIVDRDLGDEVRSTASLSGGESFLVSLALALALSSVSAKNVRVRTLLIDEGFGTLDPTALDTALSVLDALQATGCQVGIISHVPGLLERVAAHVLVRPLGGGRSTVEIRAAG